MNNRIVWGIAAAVVFAAACGEDKNYGDPLTDPSAVSHANAAITNTSGLSTDTTNDSSLSLLNGLSANMNLLAGIKMQRDQAPARLVPTEAGVDEACVVVTESSISYNDCDWNGVTVNGSVSRSGTHVSIDLSFVNASDPDYRQTTRSRGEIDISDTAITGFVDFDLDIETDGGTISGDFDGDFDVVLDNGCPVGGFLEIHAVASAAGRTQSVWVKADYGPACGDVVVR